MPRWCVGRLSVPAVDRDKTADLRLVDVDSVGLHLTTRMRDDMYSNWMNYVSFVLSYPALSGPALGKVENTSRAVHTLL